MGICVHCLWEYIIAKWKITCYYFANSKLIICYDPAIPFQNIYNLEKSLLFVHQEKCTRMFKEEYFI